MSLDYFGVFVCVRVCVRLVMPYLIFIGQNASLTTFTGYIQHLYFFKYVDTITEWISSSLDLNI